jgi:REP element-mobilizing transposase RayT
MTARQEQYFHNGVYFITFTCYKWISLFGITNGYSLVYQWFDVLIAQGSYIIGYVIMPNHIHAIIAFREHEQSINTRVSNGKRFIAYGLVNLLKQSGHEALLKTLASGVNATDRTRGKSHHVFKASFDCKECRDKKFLLQKLNYIHANPCRGKWNLADLPENYPHSSAYFYQTGRKGIYRDLTSYMMLDKTDLWKTL